MERRFIVAILCIALVCLTGCDMILSSTESTEDMTIRITVEDTESEYPVERDKLKDLSKGDLLYIFEEKNDENILDSFYGDFDHDGIREMFVVTGEELTGPIDQQEVIYGQLWLVNSRDVQLVAEDFSSMSNKIEIWKFDATDYLAVSKSYITGNRTYFWTVEDGYAKKDSASGLGDIRKVDGSIQVMEVTEDAMLENGQYKGQTIKSYDMYYDGSFKEYGAVVLSKARFFEYKNAEAIWAQLETDYPGATFTVLYHNNHKFYINIQCPIENITYLSSAIIVEKQGELSLVEIIEGNYKKACLKEIAIYPSRVN